MSRTTGYARVSTAAQDLQLQLDALAATGCEPVFTDHASGAKSKRPGLDACVEELKAKAGDGGPPFYRSALRFLHKVLNLTPEGCKMGLEHIPHQPVVYVRVSVNQNVAKGNDALMVADPVCRRFIDLGETGHRFANDLELTLHSRS